MAVRLAPYAAGTTVSGDISSVVPVGQRDAPSVTRLARDITQVARTTYVDQSQTIDSSADHIIRSEDSQDIASEPTTTIVDDFDTDPDGGTDALQPPDPVETDLESM